MVWVRWVSWAIHQPWTKLISVIWCYWCQTNPCKLAPINFTNREDPPALVAVITFFKHSFDWIDSSLLFGIFSHHSLLWCFGYGPRHRLSATLGTIPLCKSEMWAACIFPSCSLRGKVARRACVCERVHVCVCAHVCVSVHPYRCDGDIRQRYNGTLDRERLGTSVTPYIQGEKGFTSFCLPLCFTLLHSLFSFASF